MTLLIRKVDPALPWPSLHSEINSGKSELPFWALREFMPTKRDETGISVFSISETNLANKVAGAFALVSQKLTSGRMMFLATTLETFEENKISILNTNGNLCINEVNSMHREIKINNLSQIPQIVSLFLKSAPIIVHNKDFAAAAKEAAQSNNVNFSAVANQFGANIVEFVKSGVVEVRGCKF